VQTIESDPACTCREGNADDIGKSTTGAIRTAQKQKGFKPVRVHTDPQSAFWIIATEFENLTIDIERGKRLCTKGGFQDQEDTGGMYRSVKAGFVCKLPATMVKDLVAYCMSRMNSNYVSNQPKHSTKGTLHGNHNGLLEGVLLALW
jgi:hypothetical protein